MNPNDIVEFQNVGISGEDDLRYAEFVDLPGSIAIIKRRKLDMIGTFLDTGGTFTATITSVEIQQILRVPAVRAGGAVLLPPGAPDP